ncbi:MAG: TolC family protein [Ketobacteraceae bacterium]|nr:TolC family protein [Ketobacteraceae bacterium]
MKYVIACFMLLASMYCAAAMTENDIVERGISDSVFKAGIEARLAQAQGKVAASGRWQNPTVEFSRETLDVPGGSSEETSIWIEQRINIAGVKRLESDMAELNLDSVKAQLQVAERSWVNLLRRRFYALLATGVKLEHLDVQLSQLKSVASIVAKREAKGDASRFDLQRINQQLAMMLSEKSMMLSDFNIQQDQLFSALELQPQSIAGDLLPSQDVSSDFDPESHPDILALAARKQTFLTEAKAADRSRWPELTLAIGHKEVSEPGQDADGNMLAVGVEIPLFSGSDAQQQIASAQAHQAQADLIRLRRELNAGYVAVLRQYQTLKETAEALAFAEEKTQPSLSRLAELSYQAGELGVMELLGAYQSDLETRLRFVDTALAARQAYIQLQQFRGE